MNKEYICANCGKIVTDLDDVEFTNDKAIFTYKCECGQYVELHHSLILDNIKIIEEGGRND